MAINSDWVSPDDGVRTRHVIVMFTDAPTHRLDDAGYRKKAEKSPLYPKDSPADINGIFDEWNEKMDPRSKRMILFAPDAYPWGLIDYTFQYSILNYVSAGTGHYISQLLYDTLIMRVCEANDEDLIH